MVPRHADYRGLTLGSGANGLPEAGCWFGAASDQQRSRLCVVLGWPAACAVPRCLTSAASSAILDGDEPYGGSAAIGTPGCADLSHDAMSGWLPQRIICSQHQGAVRLVQGGPCSCGAGTSVLWSARLEKGGDLYRLLNPSLPIGVQSPTVP